MYLKSNSKGNSQRKRWWMANHLLDDIIMSFLLFSVQFIILPLDWLQKLTFIDICNKYADQLMRTATAISSQHLFYVGFLWLVAKIDIHRNTYLHRYWDPLMRSVIAIQKWFLWDVKTLRWRQFSVKNCNKILRITIQYFKFLHAKLSLIF